MPHVPVDAPARILVVDDDEANLLAAEALLRDLGYPIVTARSGADALRAVLRDEFAVILLDVRMPGMDGYETAELIRQRERSRHVPIIFLSGVAKDAAQQFRGYAAGAVDYVLKPAEPVILRSKVAVFAQLFEQRQQMRRTAEAERRLLAENLAVRAREAEVAQALERSLATQSLVLDTLPLALFTAAADDLENRHFVGGNVQALCGAGDEAGFAPGDWMDRVHPDDRDRLRAAVADTVTAGHYEIEYRIGCGAEDRWMLERADLRDTGEGARALYGVITDISTRKRLEEQLVHAQKLDAIGQLSGGVAHDFNNMLGVIIGSLDRVLAVAELDERTHRRVSLAMQAAQSCADLTKRLLGFARRQALQPREIAIGAELERLHGLFERVLGETVSVAYQVEADLPPVVLDPSQLEGAIVNLVVNARDAMPDGGRVTVSACVVDLDAAEAQAAGLSKARFVRLSVSDTGTGMDAATQARAMEPFFTTKAPGRGTGLGLSSIYGFMRQSGGGLRIESARGQGTTMHLYLPPAPPSGAARQVPPSPSAQKSLAGLRVALVEDNAELRSVTSGMLREIGCRVQAHASGDAAAAAIDLDATDLLMTDCVMAGSLDGPGLASALRRRNPALPVLFVSGYRAGTDPLQVEAGGFLPKPYDRVQLAEALCQAVASAATLPGLVPARSEEPVAFPGPAVA